MKLRGMVMAALGVLASAGLVVHYGLSAIGSALAVAGWPGLAAVTLFHLLPLFLCAVAWRALQRAPGAAMHRFVGFRLVRNTGSVVGPAGPLLGIRAMTLGGIDLDLAAASTVVDTTVELAAQLVFTAVGIIALVMTRPGGPIVGSALAGLGILVLLLAGLASAQRFGPFRFLSAHTGLGWFRLARAAGIEKAIHGLYRHRSGVRLAFGVHLAAWFLDVAEAGLALYLLAHPFGLLPLLVLESLSCAIRTASFFVPAAAGIQEGGYVLLGALYGLPPETALSLSFLKRGRELILAAAGFALWQTAEGRSHAAHSA